MPRGRPVVNRLELNAEQTATLKAIANSRSEELRRVQRAKAFLGAAAGKSQKEIPTFWLIEKIFLCYR